MGFDLMGCKSAKMVLGFFRWCESEARSRLKLIKVIPNEFDGKKEITPFSY
jgi:hypothetical protein